MKKSIAYSGIIACITLGGIIGYCASVIIFGILTEEYIIHLMIALGAFIGGVLAVIRVRIYLRADKRLAEYLTLVPENAFAFIKEIIRQMRYRKKVRSDVMSELVAHFEDELRECKTDEEKRRMVSELVDGFGDPKLLGILLRRAKKRCRPLWRTITARALQAFGIFIVLLTMYVVWFLSGRPVVTTDYLAELNRIVRPAADQSQNAAPFYIKAAEMFKDIPEDMAELFNKCFEELTDEEKENIEDWLNSKNQVFELVAQGSLKPYYWPEYKANEKKELLSVLVPHLSGYRRIARSLILRVRLNAEKNNLNQAFDDIITCYKLGRHLNGDFSLVEQLVGMAIEDLSVEAIREILNRHQPDAHALEELQNELELLLSSEDFFVELEFEKLSLYDEIQRCFTDGPFGGHLYPARMIYLSNTIATVGETHFEEVNFWYLAEQALTFPMESLRILFAHPDKKQTFQQVDYIYNYYQQLSKKSPVELRAEEIDIENKTTKVIKGNLLLEMFIPSVLHVFELNHRVKTEIYATVVIIAAHRYKNDKGHFPDNLNELVAAGYLNCLPIDSFSDRPLIYKKTGNDFILYSIGLNFIDDGGVLGTDRGGKTGMWEDNGDAVFWPVQK